MFIPIDTDIIDRQMRQQADADALWDKVLAEDELTREEVMSWTIERRSAYVNERCPCPDHAMRRAMRAAQRDVERAWGILATSPSLRPSGCAEDPSDRTTGGSVARIDVEHPVAGSTRTLYVGFGEVPAGASAPEAIIERPTVYEAIELEADLIMTPHDGRRWQPIPDTEPEAARRLYQPLCECGELSTWTYDPETMADTPVKFRTHYCAKHGPNTPADADDTPCCGKPWSCDGSCVWRGRWEASGDMHCTTHRDQSIRPEMTSLDDMPDIPSSPPTQLEQAVAVAGGKYGNSVRLEIGSDDPGALLEGTDALDPTLVGETVLYETDGRGGKRYAIPAIVTCVQRRHADYARFRQTLEAGRVTLPPDPTRAFEIDETGLLDHAIRTMDGYVGHENPLPIPLPDTVHLHALTPGAQGHYTEWSVPYDPTGSKPRSWRHRDLPF